MNEPRSAIMISQDSMAEIATDKDMTGQAVRVMLVLMGRLESDNYIPIQPAEIAKNLAMHPSDVGEALRLLADKGIILETKEGAAAAYKLNPGYASRPLS